MKTLRTPIFLYHQVAPLPADPPPLHAGNYLSPRIFAAQLDWLAAHGYRTVTVRDLLAASRSAGSSRRQVALSFDDGYRSFLDYAWPELERREMTATVYAVSGQLGGENRWDQAAGERREPLLGVGQLRELAAAGVEIGSHGASHVDLTAVRGEALEREVAGSKAALEDALGRMVETFCYPYAHFDPAARAAVERAGYAGAVSVWGWPGVSSRDRFGLPRRLAPTSARGAEMRWRVSPVYPLLRRLPRLGLGAALARTERR